MDNHPVIDYPIKISIYTGLAIAMFDYQRVSIAQNILIWTPQKNPINTCSYHSLGANQNLTKMEKKHFRYRHPQPWVLQLWPKIFTSYKYE